MLRLAALISTMAVLLFGVGSAWAQGAKSDAMALYGTLRIGTAHLSSSTIDYGTPITSEMETDTGFTFSAAIGAEIAPSIRVEGEVARTANEAEQFLDVGGIDGAAGDITSFSFLANAYYDFPVLSKGVSPYLTAGAGLINVSFDNVIRANSFFASSDDTSFAWQIGAGAEYRYKPKMRFLVEYRYLGTTGLTFKDAGSNSFDADYDLHSFRFGVRMMF